MVYPNMLFSPLLGPSVIYNIGTKVLTHNPDGNGVGALGSLANFYKLVSGWRTADWLIKFKEATYKHLHWEGSSLRETSLKKTQKCKQLREKAKDIQGKHRD